MDAQDTQRLLSELNCWRISCPEGHKDGLVMLAPKVIHGCIAAVGDYFTVKLATRIFGRGITGWITFCTLTSWYHHFIATRALSSGPEMALTVAALFYWPFPNLTAINRWSLELALGLASLACLLRPTSAVLWVFLGVQQLLRPRPTVSRVRIIGSAGAIMTFALCAMFLVDSRFFGERVVTPWRFFRFNVALSVSAFYGVSAWYFYPFLGLPTLLTTFLPFACFGARNSFASRQLLAVLGYVLVVYSLLPHKELRFIYPMLPLLLVVVAHGLQLYKPTRGVATLLAVSQFGVGIYFSRWHQSGVIQVMHQLHYDPNVESVGFLMPCHSTPYHSHLHRALPMWFLTCHPPLNGQSLATYKDVSDRFYDHPGAFLATQLAQNYSNWEMYVNANSTVEFKYFWPSHLVLFESLLTAWPEVGHQILEVQRYHLCYSFFNSHFHEDERRRGHVLVFCR
ncbi:glycosylphosphatidylinositol anchor biosynthesis [Massospora cicadina]|nr:glycosylphosphatidylinositol anchor biosynthesis [Massospora cicadina]